MIFTQTYHSHLCGNVVQGISQPDGRQVWRIKGGDEILHELVITGPVACKAVVRVDHTVLGGISLNKNILPRLDNIVFLPTSPYIK